MLLPILGTYQSKILAAKAGWENYSKNKQTRKRYKLWSRFLVLTADTILLSVATVWLVTSLPLFVKDAAAAVGFMSTALSSSLVTADVADRFWRRRSKLRFLRFVAASSTSSSDDGSASRVMSRPRRSTTNNTQSITHSPGLASHSVNNSVNKSLTCCHLSSALSDQFRHCITWPVIQSSSHYLHFSTFRPRPGTGSNVTFFSREALHDMWPRYFSLQIFTRANSALVSSACSSTISVRSLQSLAISVDIRAADSFACFKPRLKSELFASTFTT